MLAPRGGRLLRPGRRAVGFLGAAKIANGRLAMMTIIGMSSTTIFETMMAIIELFFVAIIGMFYDGLTSPGRGPARRDRRSLPGVSDLR